MLPWCAFNKQPSNSASWERVLLHDRGIGSANARASTRPVQKDTETGFVLTSPPRQSLGECGEAPGDALTPAPRIVHGELRASCLHHSNAQGTAKPAENLPVRYEEIRDSITTPDEVERHLQR